MAYAPIQNPVYLDATPWPYIKGPNYTRPVFAEHTARGNFAVSPIIRMPRLDGLGGDPQTALPPTPQPSPPLTAAVMCEQYKGAGSQVYAQCLQWNKGVVDAIEASNNDALTARNTAQEVAGAKCKGVVDANAWAKCYFGVLVPQPWYANPWYLGGAIVAAAIALGLITQQYRT